MLIAQENTTSLNISNKLKAYFELSKFRLSFLVSFSAAIGYILSSSGSFHFFNLVLFSIGGFFITASSNIINQIIEVDFDRVMQRTQNRPLPTSRVSINESIVLSIIFCLIGSILILNFGTFNALLLSLISSVLYAFVYTPLKRKGPIAVFVGAIPGALPPLIGWLANQDAVFSIYSLLLFFIQFVWQFPHFWAIAWVLDDDYKKAGFRLLPADGTRSTETAFQIMIYSIGLIPLGLLPFVLGLSGVFSAIVCTVLGVLFLIQTIYLMKECSHKAALQLMFGSFIYLPVVQLSLVLNKI